jgi:phosphatidylcholine synthase
MMLATAIDASDGWLARRARVKEVLPGFDGSALDNLIDFHTYTSLPLLLIWRAGLLPGGLAWLLVLPAARQRVRVLPGQRQDDDGFSSDSLPTGTSSPTTCSSCSRRRGYP